MIKLLLKLFKKIRIKFKSSCCNLDLEVNDKSTQTE